MSIKSFRLLWIKLQLPDKSFPGISFPIPLYIFQELLDCILDLLTVAHFFTSKKPATDTSSRIRIYSLRALVIIAMKLLDSFTGEEPYDLVDVTTGKVRVLIRVR